MNLAVMQPYIFPYIGYFQLIHLADKFVFYDDVNFIKQGWINRNRILVNGQPSYFTVPVMNVSSNSLIAEAKTSFPLVKRKKILKTIDQSYRKASQYEQVRELIGEVLMSPSEKVADLAIDSVIKVTEFLGLKVSFLTASQRYENNHLARDVRLLDICSQEGATKYFNPEGGADLYSKKFFNKTGIDLVFLRSNGRSYFQFAPKFVPNLSIIDVLMHNDKKVVKTMLDKDYELI